MAATSVSDVLVTTGFVFILGGFQFYDVEMELQ